MVECNFRLGHTGVYEASIEKGTVIKKEDMENAEIQYYLCDLVSGYPHRCDEEECIKQLQLKLLREILQAIK